ncbi:MAG: cadmium-translocating P-type ATPase [Bacteroidaceae bacterium]|nr:cadmium-translocating P-type ATPase [Bacteroidaceae bacterium]
MDNKDIVTATFPVLNMACAACSAAVEQTLQKQKGVAEATVNLAAAQARVVYDARVTSPRKLAKAVKSAGFVLVEPSDNNADVVAGYHRDKARRWRVRMVGSLLFFLPLMVLSMYMPNIPYLHYILWALATPVLFGFGIDFFKGAWQQACHGRANMDTLVAVSTSVAYIFSVFNTLFPEYWLQRGLEPHVYFEASAGIIAFVSIGKMLEERAKDNTTAAISKLMGLQPNEVVRVAPSGDMETIAIASVVVGDCLVARPGERIAVDGVVDRGMSYVDESMLTGEPMPISKQSGDTLYAGTLNGKGVLYYVARKTGDATLLSQIIRVVQDAQGSKAPVQRLVDKVASVFVPVVMSIAIIAFVVWLLVGGEGAFSHALMAFVTVLVIACPCALGLATPTAITVGIGKAAQQGILIKNADALESACRVTAIVLDKTGTITEGRPAVVHSRWDDETVAKRVLYAVEKHSEHPLAQAIVAHLHIDEVCAVTDFESLPGRGVKASVDTVRYFIGNRRLLEELGIAIPDDWQEEACRWEKEANSVVWLASTERVMAVLAISDPLKATSQQAVAHLHAEGLKVYMLTGDNASTAHAVAHNVGIEYVEAGVLPEQKAGFVKSLQEQGEVVAMIGDGINDSAALAQADVSIAMGQGSDIAMDVAGMTIISSDLTHIAQAIHISRQTVTTIRQNLFWAFIYNIVGIPIAAGVLYPVCGFLLNPMIASAAMALSSVSVVSNSLRLKWKK